MQRGRNDGEYLTERVKKKEGEVCLAEKSAGKRWKRREMNVRGKEISRKTDEVKERANELR